MKAKNSHLIGLFVLLVGCISSLAHDNPAQAAARAALMQKLAELSKPQTQPVLTTASRPEAAQPSESAKNLKASVTTNAVAPPSKVATDKTVQSVAAPASTHQKREVTKAKAAQSHVLIKTHNPAVVVKPADELVKAPTSTHPEWMATKGKAAQSHVLIKAHNTAMVVKPAADNIVTATGMVYKNVHVEQVDQNGIIISYSIANGGLAMTHLYFADLPAQLRARYKK